MACKKKRRPTKKKKKVQVEKEIVPYSRPFRIVLTINGFHKQYLSIPIRQESFARKVFNDLLEKNQQEVIFPKTVMILNNKYIKANYSAHIVVDPNSVKKYRQTPTYDENGNEISPELFLGKWVRLKTEPFLVEETFYVYKYHHLTDRKDFAWIYTNIITAHQDQPVRNALRYKNKIVIFNDNIFDMIICKVEDEAKKLYTMLKGVSIESKNTAVLFMGTCAKENNWRIFDRIKSETGWHEDRIWCSTSRGYK